MNTSKFTKTQKLLMYGLKHHPINKEDSLAIFSFMENNEEDQLLMIHYLQTNPNASEQEVLNASGDILMRRKKLMNSSENQMTKLTTSEIRISLD